MYGTPERPATGGYQTVSTNVPPTDGETPPPRPRVPTQSKKLATAALFSVLVTAAFLKADARNARRRAKQAAKEAKPELFDWTGFIPPAYGGAGEPTATPSTSVAPTEYQPSAAPTIDTSYYVCCFPSYKQCFAARIVCGRVAATPRLGRGYSVERGDAAARRPPCEANPLRVHGRSTWQPRRRRDTSPRTIHVAAAAVPRLAPRRLASAQVSGSGLRSVHL